MKKFKKKKYLFKKKTSNSAAKRRIPWPNSAAQFRGKKPKFRGSARNSGGRGKLWALQISKPLRCIYIYIYMYIYIYIYIQGEVRDSLVATSAAARCQGSQVLPQPGQKSGSSFLLHVHRCSACGTTTSGTRASPKPGNSPKK